MRLIFLFSLVLITYSQALAQAWELKKEGEGIQVFTRSVPKSSIKEFKAIGTINASCKQIYNVLRDVPAYSKWIEDVNHSETLSESANELSFYYQLSLPWPIKDRDLILDMKITESDDRIHLGLEGNPGELPENKDYVRMHQVSGEWILTKIDESSSHVEHRFLADPEGSIPAWVINLFIVDGPYKSMTNLREFVKTHGQ